MSNSTTTQNPAPQTDSSELHYKTLSNPVPILKLSLPYLRWFLVLYICRSPARTNIELDTLALLSRQEQIVPLIVGARAVSHCGLVGKCMLFP